MRKVIKRFSWNIKLFKKIDAMYHSHMQLKLMNQTGISFQQQEIKCESSY